MAHLDWKSRQMHGAPFENMRAMLQKGQIKSQFKADQLVEQAKAKAQAAAKKRMDNGDPFNLFASDTFGSSDSMGSSSMDFGSPIASSPSVATVTPQSSPLSPGNFLAGSSLATTTPRSSIRGLLEGSSTPLEKFDAVYEAEEV
jgi:hypothetical protein